MKILISIKKQVRQGNLSGRLTTYDENVKHNGSAYFYRKDAQANIVALLDSNGNSVVKYMYDAWGQCVVDTSTTNSELAELNPFRYRSYYYDTETNLYFLKTRYYDPEIGRFMTIDDLSYLDPETINGLNLYAYCLNNPVMYVDPTGHIIAGQSNAGGYTPVNAETISELWDKALTGVPTVISAGSANSSMGTTTIRNSYGWEQAKAGQGKSIGHMGVEVGMAFALYNGFYDSGSERTAGLIKYAHGGTSIFNNTSGENACEGNWVSPSYADYLNVEYTGLTGGLYRSLLRQVVMRLDELEDIGYENISIKGVFWMQGEADRNQPVEYMRAFGYFLSDLRRDLGALTKQDLSSLPVIIGQISRTFSGADASSIQTNETFISAQKQIAESMDNVYTVESGSCDITYWDATSGTSKNYGIDPYHWNQENIFRIGEMVGRCIIDNILSQ